MGLPVPAASMIPGTMMGLTTGVVICEKCRNAHPVGSLFYHCDLCGDDHKAAGDIVCTLCRDKHNHAHHVPEYLDVTWNGTRMKPKVQCCSGCYKVRARVCGREKRAE